MKKEFNEDNELLELHGAGFNVAKGLILRGISKNQFLEYADRLYDLALDKLEASNVKELRKQLDTLEIGN